MTSDPPARVDDVADQARASAGRQGPGNAAEIASRQDQNTKGPHNSGPFGLGGKPIRKECLLSLGAPVVPWLPDIRAPGQYQ